MLPILSRVGVEVRVAKKDPLVWVRWAIAPFVKSSVMSAIATENQISGWLAADTYKPEDQKPSGSILW